MCLHKTWKAEALLAALLVSACSDRNVYLGIPLIRSESPEPSQAYGSVSITSNQSARITLTPDQTVTPPNPANPDLSRDEAGPGLLRYEYHALSGLTAGLSATQDGFGPRIRYSLIQPQGRPGAGDWSLAVSGGYAYFDRSFFYDDFSFLDFCNDDDENFTTRLKSHRLDAGLIGGVRVLDTVLVYGGPYWNRLRYSGDYDSSNSPDFEFNGRGYLRGGHLGVMVDFNKTLGLSAEFSRGAMQTAGRREYLDGGVISLRVSFAQKRRAEDEQEEPPVKVIPAAEPGV